MAEQKKRINFSRDELILLKRLVLERPIIDTKMHDQKTENLRKEAWKETLIKFNAAGLNTLRNVEQLKGAWKRVKRDYKIRKAEERRRRFRTGGGPPSPQQERDPETDELLIDQEPKQNIPDDDDDFNVDDAEVEGLERMRSASPKPDTPTAGSSTANTCQANTPSRFGQPRVKRASSLADEFHSKKMECLEEEHRLRMRVIEEEHKMKVVVLEKERNYWTMMEANAENQLLLRENTPSGRASTGVATTDNVEKNVQSSGNLTESSQQPIASTSTSVQPKPVVKKATTAKTSERKKIAGPTDMQVATTATSTNNETALLHEKIRQLEEINIQLQIENESYRIKNVMLETQKNKLIGKLKTIVKAKDPLALGENTLIFEQHSERLTVGPISSASNPGYPTASTATLTGDSQIDDIIGTHSQDYSDADNAGDDDDSSYLDNMGGGGGQIEIDVDVDPAFETVDIKPLIVHGEVQPQPQTTKRKRNSDPLDPSATSSKRSTPLKKKLLCDFGDEGNEDDDDEPDYGDDFDSEEDSAKVRRAYELLKSVFDKKDKYDLFCDRLAGRLRALQSPKVCRHVQQILVTAVADAEAGKFDNI